MTQDFAQDLLSSLSAQIAVLDEQGVILMVNEAWRSFARANGGEEAASGVGVNYLAVCEAACRSGQDEVAARMLEGFHALLRREREEFDLEYPCHSPSEQRWFAVRVTRFVHAGKLYLASVHENITARKLAEAARAETETTLRNVLEALPVGVWIVNSEGKIVHGNPAGLKIWGGGRYVGPEQFGEYKGWWLDSGRRIAAEEWAAARAIMRGEISIDEEIRIECFDGSGKIILNSALPLRDADGRVSGAIIVNQDISVRKTIEEELRVAKAAADAANRELREVLAREQHKARTDPLTGLSNRRHFFEVAEHLFLIGLRYRRPLSLLLFDIDHFKRINDSFGHAGGDAILKCVARIAREHTRASDVLARYGGEEFIMLLPDSSKNEASAAAEMLRERVAACEEMLDGSAVGVTVSIGVAQSGADDDSLERLIQRADSALYAAKREGRNRVVVASA